MTVSECPGGLSLLSCTDGGGTGSGVTQIIAGTNVTISPVGGTGAVTVNSSGGGTPGGSPGQVQVNVASAFGGYANFTHNGTSVVASSEVIGPAGSTALSFGGFTEALQIQGTTQGSAAFAQAIFSTASAPEFVRYRSRSGTIGAATAVVSGDLLGRDSWFGASLTGTFSSQVQAASQRVIVDGPVTATSVPGRYEWGVTAVGGLFAVTQMTLFSTGKLNLASLTASQFVMTDSSKSMISIDLFGGSNTWTGVNTFSGSGAILAMTNNSAITFDSTSLIKDSFGTPSIDPYNRILSDSTATTALTYGAGDRILWDDSGNESLDWNARQLANALGNIVYDYANGWLYYDSGTIFISVNDGELRDAFGVASLNASQRKAYDPTGAIVMMDWNMVQNASAFLSFDTSGNPFFTQSIHAQSNVYVTNFLNVATLNASSVVGTDAAKNLISIAAPTIAANVRGTGKTAAFSLGAYTVPAVDTTFMVSANVLVTSSTAFSFTVTCTYTDESNTSRVLTLNFSQLTGTFVTTLTNVLGASAYEGVPVQIRCKASTTITIQSTGTFTTVTYNIEERIISLGA